MIGQVERLARLKKELDKSNSETKNNIISIVSGKGGTGKSVLSLNLAYQLALLKKKVLLVDLDINFSSIALMLNILPEYTLGDYLLGKVLFDEIITPFRINYDLILGDNGAEIPESDSREIVAPLFKKLNNISENYDFILIDNGAGLNERISYSLKQSSHIISVSTTEPTAVMDSYVVLKHVIKNELSAERYAVINKASSLEEGKQAYNNLNEATIKFFSRKTELLGIVNNSSHFNRSIINQTILSESHPESHHVKQILNIAKKIAEFKQVANNQQLKLRA